ncbi:MAG: permease [Alphaproteobacteria bacterium]|nr:permease [Alphaproteobacteria bacterium]
MTQPPSRIKPQTKIETPGGCCAAAPSPPADGLDFLGAIKVQAARVDRVIWAILAVFAALAFFAPTQVAKSFTFTGWALVDISPFLLFSVAVAAAAHATGSDKLIAKVFSGKPATMIAAAALFGSLSPFCSCGVIPIVAGLLGAGVPLAPVMAFWISSPLMDPQMFILSAAALGLPFTIAKTMAAFVIGLAGGFATLAALKMGLFANPLSGDLQKSCCGGSSDFDIANEKPSEGILWAFWHEAPRRKIFSDVFWDTAWFLGKWLTLAFLLESLMVAYIPASLVADVLGGGAWWTIPAAVGVGIPTYLNGFAAIPLMAGLMDLGMAPGAALAFMIAGGVTSIPAAMAVFALVRRQVFLWYLVISLTGSMAAGLLYQLTISA